MLEISFQDPKQCATNPMSPISDFSNHFMRHAAVMSKSINHNQKLRQIRGSILEHSDEISQKRSRSNLYIHDQGAKLSKLKTANAYGRRSNSHTAFQ